MLQNIHKNILEDSIIFSNNDVYKDIKNSESQDIYYYTYNDNNLIFSKSCKSVIYNPSNQKYKKFKSFLKNTKELNFKEKLIQKINNIQKNQQKTNNNLSSLISILFNALLIKNNYSVSHFDFVLKNNFKPKILKDENITTDNLNNQNINNIFRFDYNLSKSNKKSKNSKTIMNKVQQYYKSNININENLNNTKKITKKTNYKKIKILNNNEKNDNKIHNANSHTANNLAEENDICNLTEEKENNYKKKERIILENVKEINTKLSAKDPVKITFKPLEKSISLNIAKNKNERKNINFINSVNNSYRNIYKNNIKNITKVETENSIETNKQIKDNNKNFNENENVSELFKSQKNDEDKYDSTNKKGYPKKIRGFNFRNNINNSSNNKRPNSTKPSNDINNENKREMHELNNINLHNSNILKKNIMTVCDFNKNENELENEFEDEPNINKYFYMSNRK